MAFLVNPFLFFYYEEKQEEERIIIVCENIRKDLIDFDCFSSSEYVRQWNGLLGFSFFWSSYSFLGMLLHLFYHLNKQSYLSIRIFVPQLATLPADNSTSEWERVKYLIDHFDSSRKKFFLSLSPIVTSECFPIGVEDSICFAIFTLSVIGFFLLTIYTVNHLCQCNEMSISLYRIRVMVLWLVH